MHIWHFCFDDFQKLVKITQVKKRRQIQMSVLYKDFYKASMPNFLLCHYLWVIFNLKMKVGFRQKIIVNCKSNNEMTNRENHVFIESQEDKFNQKWEQVSFESNCYLHIGIWIISERMWKANLGNYCLIFWCKDESLSYFVNTFGQPTFCL